MAENSYPGLRVPTSAKELLEWARHATERFGQLLLGKMNVNLVVNLRAGFATTVVDDVRIGTLSNFLFSPRTANAAAVAASIYYGTIGDGTVTIHHTNNANADKDGVLTIIG